MSWPIIVEWLSRLVFALLLGLSVWSIAIIIERRRFFQAFKHFSVDLLQVPSSPDQSKLGHQRLQEFSQQHEFVSQLLQQRALGPAMLKYFLAQTRKSMEKNLSVLGTLGPIAPFIGLLGTILGIIVSFAKLSQGGGGTNAVMFSLAEALILTALGLLVAIPAVVAYNVFSRRIKIIFRDIELILQLTDQQHHQPRQES